MWTVCSRLIIDREKNNKGYLQQRLKDGFANSDPSKYDFLTYGSYAQMVAWMHALARKYPTIVQFISIGKSHEGRSIDGLEVKFAYCLTASTASVFGVFAIKLTYTLLTKLNREAQPLIHFYIGFYGKFD